jgi:outer membrane protein OmpA-like peptidoglycan-associated protein
MTLIARPNSSTSAAVWMRGVALVGAIGAAVAGCASTPRPIAVRAIAPTCADVNFPIYFAKGSDQLSDPAHQAILAGAAQVKSCKVSEVDVLGLADVDGPAAANQALSRRRASIVAQALIAAGMPAPLFDVEGLGETGARTAHGRRAILQRKAEVDIHIAPPAPVAPAS